MTYRFAKDKLNWSLALLWACCGCDDAKITGQPKAVSGETEHSAAPREETGAERQECPSFSLARELGKVESPRLLEISGLVAASDDESIIWVHNDSGDDAFLYAMSHQGVLQALVKLKTEARDWEEMARQPRSGKRALLYVADTGDNLSVRKEGVLIHRFEEPDLKAARAKYPEPLEVSELSTMRVRYPSGPVDAEALLVDPSSDEILLISKPRMELPEIYSTRGFAPEATLKFEGTIAPERCGQLIHLVTAADISPDGRWIALRTYDDVLFFERHKGESIAATLRGRACFIEHSREPQGEAIGFVPSAKKGSTPSFLTTSEGVKQPIYRYDVVDSGTK